MRLAIVSFLLCFTHVCLSAQKVSIDNQVIRVSADTASNRSSFTCSHKTDLDTALLENLSCWIYAKSNNQPYLSIQNGINYNDVHFGLSSQYPNIFNTLSMVSRPQIVDHKYQFGQPQYTIPKGIEKWPGSSNQEQIAAYVDVNQNSMYEPAAGDYPFIRGDQCLVGVSHDATNRSSNLPAVQTSLVQYTFLFPNSGDPILDHTIGFRWVLKNQSNRTYDTAKVGVQFHALLNKLNSNYIGTDVKHNAMFAYPSNLSQQKYTSVMLLNQSITNTMYYKNTGQTNNKNDIPTLQEHYVNYLHSRWKDGDTLKLGSTGLDGDSSISFVFPNTTLSGYSAWSEEVVGNQGGDRNGLLVCELRDWAPNEYKVIEGAILFQADIDSLPELYERHAMIRNIYANSDFSNIVPKLASSNLQIYPNPAKGNNKVRITAEKEIAQLRVFSHTGKLLLTQHVHSKSVLLEQTNILRQTIFIHVLFEDGTTATRTQLVR